MPADEVTPEKSFVDDLDIDSLSMVEIAVAAQDKFGVEIPDDQLKNLKTVQDVVNYVHERGRSGLTWAGRRPPSAEHGAARLPATELRSDSQWGQTNDASSSPAWAQPRPSAAMSPQPGRRCWPDAAASGADRRLGPGPAGADRGAGRRRPGEGVDRVQARRLDRCEQFARDRRP